MQRQARVIAAIEPLGIDLPLYDITTGTGDFIANGVVSHNCFARPTHTYLDLDAGRDFEREIVVKVNVPEVARAELSRPSWKREHVALGTNTDPYQWVESRYKLMPGIWQALLDTDTPCSLVTKSPLALRDIDILSELAAGPGVSVYFSVPTLDEKVWRETEPHTPSPRARLDAVRKMNEAGVPSGILVAPLIPGINDAPEQVGEIMRIAAENGADQHRPIVPLHLRGEVRGIWFEWLRDVPARPGAPLRGAVQARRVRAERRSASASSRSSTACAPRDGRGAPRPRPARGRRREDQPAEKPACARRASSSYAGTPVPSNASALRHSHISITSSATGSARNSSTIWPGGRPSRNQPVPNRTLSLIVVCPKRSSGSQPVPGAAR